MKKKVKIVLASVMTVCILSAGLWYLFRPVRVETEPAKVGDLTESFTVSGTATPARSSYICAPLAGQVTGIKLRSGARAEAGENVIQLDDSEARGELEDQLASLELQKTGVLKDGSAARAEIVMNRQQLENELEKLKLEYEQLYGENGNAAELLAAAQENFTRANIAYWRAYDEYADSHDPSENAQLSSLAAARASAEQALADAENVQMESTRTYYEDTIASYESQLGILDGNGSAVSAGTEAAADQLDIQMEQIRNRLNKDGVEAPYAGTVWEVLVEEGDYVQVNQPLYRIYETGNMEVSADLLDTQASLLEEGDQAMLTLVDGTVLEGSISFVSEIATQELSALGIEESRCEVILEADLPEGVGAGQEITVEFEAVRKEHVLQVPVSAVMPDEDGQVGVYVVRGRKAIYCGIETGLQCGGKTEVTGGLSEGDQVIVNPYETEVSDGKAVVPASYDYGDETTGKSYKEDR